MDKQLLRQNNGHKAMTAAKNSAIVEHLNT
jgi:hypothetical protein